VCSQVAAVAGKKDEVLCLVMPAAERSLEHIISAERIAGVDLKAIKAFGVDIAGALQYLHDHRQGLVHGDFKPRNIVRIHGDWKLIDFDASVQVAIANHTKLRHIIL
jgi:serine/threonine protein kinase